MRNLTVETFGTDQDSDKRMYFLYDGQYYQLCVSYHPSSGDKIYLHNPKDEYSYQGIFELAKDLKKKGDFIKEGTCTLVCQGCKSFNSLTSQLEAAKHSQMTGHINFRSSDDI